MINFFNKIIGRTKRVSEQMENAQESIAFAEAGYPEIVKQEPKAKPNIARKLLVVGNESIFSHRVIDYAIEMAKRMSYEIVALNTAPLSCDSLKFLSASQQKICQEFKDIAEEQAQKFRQAAEENNLSFSHLVKYSEHDRAIEEAQAECANIEFVISDMEPAVNSETDRAQIDNRPSSQVYVYSML